MESLNWTYILYLVVGILSLSLLLLVAYRDRLLSVFLFSMSLFSFLIGVIIDFVVSDGLALAREWGDLIAITLTLCGLFVKIRDSKPVFARFPLYLTFLPLVGLLFYPLVNDSVVIKELLQITYQGGAIIVGVLILSINHYLYKSRGLLLLSSGLFITAYVFNWFFDEINSAILIKDISVILFSIGIILVSYGFKKISDQKST